jgi:type IV pilus assembly protein PilC
MSAFNSIKKWYPVERTCALLSACARGFRKPKDEAAEDDAQAEATQKSLSASVRERYDSLRQAIPVRVVVILRSGQDYIFNNPWAEGPTLHERLAALGYNILHPKEGIPALGNAIRNGAQGIACAVKQTAQGALILTRTAGRGIAYCSKEGASAAAPVLLDMWNFVIPLRLEHKESEGYEGSHRALAYSFRKPLLLEKTISLIRDIRQEGLNPGERWAVLRKNLGERWNLLRERCNEFLLPIKEYLPTEAEITQKSGHVIMVNRVTINRARRNLKMQLAKAFPSLYGVKKQEVVDFSRNLATLLESGLPILQALQVLHRQAPKGMFKDVIEKMMEDLEQGDTMSEACEKHPQVFHSFYVRLIRVGEETGNMEHVLRSLVKQMLKDEALKAKLKHALTYPSFILIFGLGIMLMLVLFVLPTMTDIYTQNNMEVPTVLSVTVDSGEWLKANGAIVLLGGLLGGILLYMYTSSVASGIRAKDTFLMKAPVIGKVTVYGRVARLSNNMSILLGAGIPLTEGFHLMIQGSESVLMKDALNQVNTDIHTGQSLSDAMSSQPIFPLILTQMVEVGEMTGRLETNLSIVGDYYEEEADKAVGKLVATLGPGMMVLIGGMVGLICVTMFSSIYGMYGDMGV